MVILVRYAEIALKSEFVRKGMEIALIRSIEDKLLSHGIEGKIWRDRGHIYITSNREKEIAPILKKTFGVVSFSHCVMCSSRIEEIKRAVANFAADVSGNSKTFAIRARREGEFGFTSMDIGRIAGSAVQEKLPYLEVNLKNPELEIYVEVRQNGTYIYSEKQKGPGGLPYGTQGRVVALIRNERDVIAAWLLMKRGCKIYAMGKQSRICERLDEWHPPVFEEIDPTIGNALRFAKRKKAQGIVCGMEPEDLLRELPEPAEMPIFLPLSGLNEAAIASLKAQIEGVEKF
ncbi:MAG: THUMP domain-containing protein [Thermoplasmata archaeon]